MTISCVQCQQHIEDADHRSSTASACPIWILGCDGLSPEPASGSSRNDSLLHCSLQWCGTCMCFRQLIMARAYIHPRDMDRP